MPTVDPRIRLRAVTPDLWECHRDLRLEMLADAPDAFWATLAEAEAMTDEQWRARTAGPLVHLQALVGTADGEELAGSLGIDPVGYTEDLPLDADTVNVVAVYVRPAFRGRRVVRALVAGAADVVRGMGRDRLLLEVTSDNAPARRAYERLGFTETGRTHPDPRRGSEFCEVEYEARLGDLRL